MEKSIRIKSKEFIKEYKITDADININIGDKIFIPYHDETLQINIIDNKNIKIKFPNEEEVTLVGVIEELPTNDISILEELIAKLYFISDNYLNYIKNTHELNSILEPPEAGPIDNSVTIPFQDKNKSEEDEINTKDISKKSNSSIFNEEKINEETEFDEKINSRLPNKKEFNEEKTNDEIINENKIVKVLIVEDKNENNILSSDEIVASETTNYLNVEIILPNNIKQSDFLIISTNNTEEITIQITQELINNNKYSFTVDALSEGETLEVTAHIKDENDYESEVASRNIQKLYSNILTLSDYASDISNEVIIQAQLDYAPITEPLIIQLSNNATITFNIGETTATSTLFNLENDDVYVNSSTLEVTASSIISGEEQFDKIDISSSSTISIYDPIDTTTISLSAEIYATIDGTIKYTASLSNPATETVYISLTNGEVIEILAKDENNSGLEGSISIAVNKDEIINNENQEFIETSINNISGGESFEFLEDNSTVVSTTIINTPSVDDIDFTSHIIGSITQGVTKVIVNITYTSSNEQISYEASITDDAWYVYLEEALEETMTINVTSYLNDLSTSSSYNMEIVESGSRFTSKGEVDDYIILQDGNNWVKAGYGDDTIQAGTGNDTIYGEGGNDTITAQEGNNKIVAGSGDDSVYAGSGNDKIYGENGNDTLYGGAGSDRIVGGNGDDIINGEIGNDSLYGGDGDDTMYGGDGNDNIVGQAGNDALYDGEGNDVVRGQTGNDTFYVGSGNDRLYGDSGNDTFNVTSESGVNSYSGGSGYDSIIGSSSDDIISLSTSSIELIDGKEGYNILQTTQSSNLNFANTELVNIDLIQGGDGKNRIAGSTGDDTIDGGAGNDILIGNQGNDTIYGGSGKDTIYAGVGNDIIYDGSENDTVKGQEGDDTFYVGEGNDKLYGEAGNDTFHVKSNIGTNSYYGGDGYDSIISSSSDDIISLTNFDNNSSIELIDGKEGYNTLQTTQSSNLNFANTELVNIDLIQGGDGKNRIAGSTGDDTIDGGAGNDILIGNQGNDTIYGGSGNDRIVGGEGDDTLIGGEGNDRLVGGEGDDKIYYNSEDSSILGGNGYDILYSEDQSINLVSLGDKNVEGIEEINLSNSSYDLKNILVNDVIDITDEDNKLYFTGEADDSLTLDRSNWTKDISSELEESGYEVWTKNNVKLYIDEDINVYDV